MDNEEMKDELKRAYDESVRPYMPIIAFILVLLFVAAIWLVSQGDPPRPAM